MEKKVYDLKIDPEFEELVAKPSEAEQTVLCESLEKYGCLDDLTVWHGFILDGHTRYRYCKEKGIPFSYREMEFDSKGEAELWILDLSLGRRSLTKYQRTKLALRYEAVWKEEAEKREKAGKKIDPEVLGPQGSGRTRERIASVAGVGPKYVDKVRRLEAEADEETKRKLERDEITVGAAFKLLEKKETMTTEEVEDKEREADTSLVKEEDDIEPTEYYGFDGKRHTGNQLPDVPESFPEILSDFELMMQTHIQNIMVCLENYTSGMHTPENNKALMSLIRKTNKEVNAMMKEALENE